MSKIGVIGAGLIGRAWSMVFARAGHDVALYDGVDAALPVAMETMLEFAARHKVTPQTEHFPMSRINDAFERLKSGQARYRIVLDADF